VDRQLGRTIAIIVVICFLAVVTLRRRAGQMVRRLPSDAPASQGSAPPPPSSGAAPAAPERRPSDPDSVSKVLAAVRAFQVDDSARGWASIALRVLKYESDTGGSVLITLLPADPTQPGGGALVRVSRWGKAVLVERY
jgi:hypothetical protein